ncbi:HipA domain-containing protein [Deminuibacter soli]|uniref:Type II toxin-antitoxin system HipA family toxin n=1 Tax=Deminuibacter soli TaxID=2291815 RepID=A0A3E1NMD4_9BACT|nr:HipA domain-containing protein [Deminuibacter soli]RFM29083.1 type II toxin-antitoxin system HipA family toxin [Deminuibacter soli]
MSKRCLYCYQLLAPDAVDDFHEQCSLEFFGTPKAPMLEYLLSDMADLAKNVVERRVAVPGVQPKLSLSLVKAALENGDRGRLTVVGALGGNYIFKPPHTDFPEMPENEHVTMRMASEVFQLSVVPSSLIRLKSGELSYVTKRIDRTEDGEKIHMLDMFQVLEASDKYKGSHERIGRAIGNYCTNTLLDQVAYFRLVLFCFLTGNSDMHLKNFSFILNNSGWGLSPAYDLLNVSLVIKDDEELSLTISGKKNKLNAELFSNLGAGLGLNNLQIKVSFRLFSNGKAAAFEWLDRSFLSEEKKVAYKARMEERYMRLGL